MFSIRYIRFSEYLKLLNVYFLKMRNYINLQLYAHPFFYQINFSMSFSLGIFNYVPFTLYTITFLLIKTHTFARYHYIS